MKTTDQIIFFPLLENQQQHLFLFGFDFGAEERGHCLHAGLVHLGQTFLSSSHLLGRLKGKSTP